MPTNVPTWDETIDEPTWEESIFPEELLAQIDPASAAVSSFIQGGMGGYLDELAGGIEGLGSLVGIKGLGGPTGQYSLGDTRSFSQAVEEGAQNKLNQLRAARQQYPVLSPAAEIAGGLASGYAIPAAAGASALKRIGTGIGLGAVGGAGYAEGGLEERLSGALQGGGIGGALPTAGAALNLTGKAIRSGASTISGIPKQWMGRYFERGPEMNKADKLPVIATEISNDLANIGKLATTKSGEAIDTLNKEGVSIPREQFIAKIKGLLANADPQNTSSKPVIAKLESYLRELEGSPATRETVNIPGTQTQTIPSQSRTVVGPPNRPPVPVQGQGYGIPRQNVRPAQGNTYNAEPIVVDVPGAKQVQTPVTRQTVVTRPRVTPPNPSGEYTKRGVRNFDEFAKWMDKEGQGSTTGAKLARDARATLDELLKEPPFGSQNYKDKMKEVDDLMTLLSESREGFSEPQTALNTIRGVGEGRETKHFASEVLNRIGKQSGKDYRSRIEDQMTLEAFNPKESLKPTRSKALPRDIWGVAQDVLESTARPVVKTTIDIGRTIDRAYSKLPPVYRKMISEARRSGGNALALTHGMLMRTEPEYAAIIEQEQQ